VKKTSKVHIGHIGKCPAKGKPLMNDILERPVLGRGTVHVIEKSLIQKKVLWHIILVQH